MSAAVGLKSHVSDYDEWCEQMAAQLTSANQHLAETLVTSLSSNETHPLLFQNVGEPQTGSDILRLRKRSKYISKSCAECKLKKRKCSEVRPCAMCVMAGTGHKCLSDAQNFVSLSTSIQDTREAYFQDVYTQEASLRSLKDTCTMSGVNITLVRPLWELGFDVSLLFKAFKILPLDLKVAVDELVDLIRQGLAKTSICNPEYQAIISQQHGLGRLSRYERIEDVKYSKRLLEEAENDDDLCFNEIASNERWGHGRWMSIEFDSKLNCKRIRIGDEVSGLLGCHHTEILTRFICHDLVKSMSEYELLVAWTSSILCSFDPQSTFYIKVLRKGSVGQDQQMVYVKCIFHKNFNLAGKQIGYTIVFEEVSPEAYQFNKNRFLPPSMRQQEPDADRDKGIVRESIVFMRKSRMTGEDRLSHLAGFIKGWVKDIRMYHPLFADQALPRFEMV